MQEEVGGTKTGGERVPDGLGDTRAIFLDVADVGGCGEGSGGSIGGPGTSPDAFGCWDEGAKGLG